MILVDTCVVSAWLGRDAKRRTPKLVRFVDDLVEGDGLCMSAVSAWELRRWMQLLERSGQGKHKRVRMEKLLRSCEILSLDHSSAWDVATTLWVDGKLQTPAVVFSDADLLIAATAAAYERPFATSDSRLAERLATVHFPMAVTFVPLE